MTLPELAEALDVLFELDAVPSEDFDGHPGGLWIRNTEDAVNKDGVEIFNHYGVELDPTEQVWTMGVLNELHTYLNDNQYHAEFHDAGTVLIWG